MEHFRTTNQRDPQLQTIFVAKQREAEGVPTPEDQTSKKNKIQMENYIKNATKKRLFQTADGMTLIPPRPRLVFEVWATAQGLAL